MRFLLPKGYSGPFCTDELVALTRVYRAAKPLDVELRAYAAKSLGDVYDAFRNNLASMLEESGSRPLTLDSQQMHCALYFSREGRVLCFAFPRPDRDKALIGAYMHDASFRRMESHVQDVERNMHEDIDFIASRLSPSLRDHARRSLR